MKKQTPSIATILRSFCISLMLPAFVSTAAIAEEPLFSTYLEAAKKASKANNNPEAIRMFEMALKNSEHLKPNNKDLIDLYDSLGNCLATVGKEKQSEEYLVKALNLRLAEEPKDELMIFRSMMFLGTLYRDQNRFQESEALYKKAMDTYKKPGMIGDLFKSTGLTALASMYLQMSRPVEAELLLKKALELRKPAEGVAPPADTIYDALGKALDAQGKHAEAEQYLLQAVQIAEKQGSPDTHALSQVNLGVVLSNQGKYKEAKELMNKALKVLEKNRGLRSPATATCYSNLAAVAIDEDQYGEAESLLNKALSIHQELLGPVNSSVAYDLLKLMAVYRNQGQYTKAQETGERAVEIFKKTIGPDAIATAQAMSRLADLYNNQLRFDDAEKLAKETIRIFSEKLGPDSVDYAIGLLLAAEVNYGKHETNDAISNMSKAAEVLSSNVNTEQGLLARIDEELSEYLQSANRLDEAETRLKQSIEIREKLWGENSLRLLPNLNSLLDLYTKTKKDTLAESLRQRISKLQEKNPSAPKALFERSPHIAAAETAMITDLPVRDKWALSIGISNFAKPELNLKYAAKDAVDFSNFLVHDEKFAPDHVKVLTDKNATRKSILDALGKDWLGKQAHPDDLVVIYISSHGSMAKTEAGGTNFLVAYDTEDDALLSTGIPMQWLTQIIKEQVHSNRIVLIMDVCHSGSVANRMDTDSAEDRGGDSSSRVVTSIAGNASNPAETKIASADISGSKGVSSGSSGAGSSIVASSSKASSATASASKASTATATNPVGSKGLSRSPSENSRESLAKSKTQFDVDQLKSGAGQAIICSSSSDQVSWESKKYPNSVFTRQLIESMQKNNSNTDLVSLFKTLQKKVEDEVLQDRGQIQTPRLENKEWQGPAPVLSVTPSSPESAH